jgi:hypothetical protein
MTKYSILKLSLIAAVLTLAPTSTLRAQTEDGRAQFKVPFAFEVGSAHCEPGVYTIGMLNAVTLHVSGARTGAFASMRPASNRETITSGKVVFHRIGNEYFLEEVWSAGSRDHLVAYQTKAEKQALKVELAANRPAATGVEIALAK